MSKYLITFDMDTNCLKRNYHGNNWNNAYADIARVLKECGFEGIQGSVYLGAEGVSEAHGTLAIQKLTAIYDWFHSCVSNIRFYRLESDLNAQLENRGQTTEPLAKGALRGGFFAAGGKGGGCGRPFLA